MRLIKPKVEILDRLDEGAIIGRIATVARTCYKSELSSSEDKDKALVKRLIDSKHEAMLEFVDVTVKFTCDRITSQSIVRHRIASFAQESSRYCNYSKDKFNNELTFIIPSWLNIPEGRYEYYGCNWVNADDNDEVFVRTRTGLGEWLKDDDTLSKDKWLSLLAQSEETYLDLTSKNWTAEKARMVLPMSIKTEINMKANLREWRHFFKLRCDKRAHPDMRILALDLLKQMHDKLPTIFEDIYQEFLVDKLYVVENAKDSFIAVPESMKKEIDKQVIDTLKYYSSM